MPYVIMAAGASGRRSIIGACDTAKLAIEKSEQILGQGMKDILISDESATLYTLEDFRRQFLPAENPDA
jgi:hypothetical protein